MLRRKDKINDIRKKIFFVTFQSAKGHKVISKPFGVCYEEILSYNGKPLGKFTILKGRDKFTQRSDLVRLRKTNKIPGDYLRLYRPD